MSLLAVAAPAAADDAGVSGQGANVTIGTPTRSKSARPDSQYPLYVSYADCESSDAFTFPITATTTTSAQYGDPIALEVWLTEGTGTDCRAQSARTGTPPACTMIATTPVTTEKNLNVVITSSSLANSISGVLNCEDSSASTIAHEVRLYFLLIRTGTAGEVQIPNADGSYWDKTQVDLLGPAAPTGLTAGVGDEVLIVNYDTTSAAKDTAGYVYFCDDGTLSAGDAGETDAGSGYATGCPASPSLSPGKVPPVTLATCGSSSGNGGPTSTLTNGVTYDVGVAAYDEIGNWGKLSAIVCASPQPIDDFFKLYRQAGGQAGGGYCSVGADGAGSALLMVAPFGALAAFAIRRRKPRQVAAKRASK